MKKRIQRAATQAGFFLAASVPVLAMGGGRLAATQAINGLGSEVSRATGLRLIAYCDRWHRN